jgi:hypothetical protein
MKPDFQVNVFGNQRTGISQLLATAEKRSHGTIVGYYFMLIESHDFMQD